MSKNIFCSLAQRTSSVFASQGVPVYLFTKITPTPFVVSILMSMYILKYLMKQLMSIFILYICSFYLMFLSSLFVSDYSKSMPRICRHYNPTARRRAMTTQRQNAINFEQFVAVLGMAVCVTGLMVRTCNYSPLHWLFFVYSRINGKECCIHLWQQYWWNTVINLTQSWLWIWLGLFKTFFVVQIYSIYLVKHYDGKTKHSLHFFHGDALTHFLH